MKKYNPSIDLVLSRVLHREQDVILLTFNYNDVIKNLLKELHIFKWSQTLKGWYCTNTFENLDLIKQKLPSICNLKIDKNSFESNRVPYFKTRNISEENKTLINAYVTYLRAKRYNENTIKAYFTGVFDFIDYVQPKPIIELSIKDVEVFLEEIFSTKKHKIVSQQQFISALKIFKSFFPECKIEEKELKHLDC